MNRVAVVTVALLGMLWMPAFAQDDTDLQNGALLCLDQPAKLSLERYLRATSLDLHGELPSETDVAAVAGLNPDADIPEAMLDAFLQDEKMIPQIVRH